MTFFRYPGGKKRLARAILPIIFDQLDDGRQYEYVEPFFGGGAIGFSVIPSFLDIKRAWLNDIDQNLFCVWNAVLFYPEELKEQIIRFKPKVEDFYIYKKQLLSQCKEFIKEEILKRAFMKIVIHQISFSGLGVKSGSPLGGRTQNSKYKIDCRWNPKRLIKKIDETRKILLRVPLKYSIFTDFDFKKVLENVDEYSFLYLDPPYFKKGEGLYQHVFSVEDHLHLSSLLQETEARWVLSYDNCEEVRRLYSWANISDLKTTYTVNSSSTRKDTELIITRG